MVNDGDADDPIVEPLIIQCVKRGCVAGVAHCIQQGHINAKDEWGWTALHYAVRLGQTELSQQLLAAGAELAGGSLSLLHLAVWWPGAMRVLLASGAPMDVQDALGFTPLHECAFVGGALASECASLLLSAGCALAAQDCDGRTAEALARSRAHVAVADLVAEEAARRSRWAGPRMRWIVCFATSSARVRARLYLRIS